MKTGSFKIDDHNLEATVLSHGWVHLSPYEWDDSRHVLGRRIRIGKRHLRIELSQRRKDVVVKWWSDAQLSRAAERQIESKARYMLGCDIGLDEFSLLAKKTDKRVHRFVQGGGGRLLRGEDLFEDTVKTLLTTNASWAFTTKMVEAVTQLRARILQREVEPAFPSPTEILQFTTAQLERFCRLGYRAAYLRNVAKHFSGNSDYLPARRKEVLEKLAEIKGLGPYSVNHLAVLLGDFERMPIDSEVRAFCREKRGLNTDREIEAHFARWAPYQFLGYKCERIVSRANWIGD